MSRLVQDVRIALRGFRRTPTFAVAVIAILGLGIGMSVAMFTTFQTILVRRLPVRDQDGIAVMWPYRVPGSELSPMATDLVELRRSSRTMRDIAGVLHFGAAGTPFVDGDRTLVLAYTVATANFFDVLGARAAVGRLFRPEDGEPGAPRVMVLSYGAWRAQFDGQASVIGRQVIEPYGRKTYTIVGVAAPGLDYPVGVAGWSPLPRDNQSRILTVARLAPGATIEAARAEFFSILNRIEPSWKLTGATALPFSVAVVGGAQPILVALTTAVALLLLIACANVGNLFLVRAMSRGRELAVRRALGASYGDLVRQLVVESVLLAAAGGALGVACAAALLRALVAFAPSQLPRLDDVRLHGSLLGAAVGVTAICVLLFGVLPAIAAARVNLASPLRADARSGTETRRRRRVRDWLVASQVALALIMLAGAGLLARSLQHLERLQLGYRTEHLSVISMAFDWAKYDSTSKLVALSDAIERRLRAMPGVTSATSIVTLPFGGANINIGLFEGEGQSPAEVDANPAVPWDAAGAQYFSTFDIPILRGRAILDSDREGAQPVVVLSQAVVRRFWPGQDALGKRVRFAPSNRAAGVTYPKDFFEWRTVVGVVPDTRFRALREASPTIYLPWRQFATGPSYWAVRSTGEVEVMSVALRRALKEIDPTIAVWNVEPVDRLIDGPLAEPRLTALLLTAFGAVALVLAAVGLYGVMSSAVREQTREIGIRMALGAAPARIRDAVMRRAIGVAGAGAAGGLAVALATTHLLRSLLFEVSPTDPVTLGAVCAVLIAVALLAAFLPARRATRVDPVQALRAE